MEGEADLELVERARGGDQAAFRNLFNRYHRRVYALAIGMVRHSDDALDLVQDAFLKAHRHLDRFQGQSSFYTWLYRIVMNLCIDHLRKQKRAQAVDYEESVGSRASDDGVEEVALLPSVLGHNPGKALVRKEMRDHIGVALERLSENHRAVLLMRELDGLSYEEMAHVMECSKGTIMSRLFHARRNMQKHLLAFMGEKDLEA